MKRYIRSNKLDYLLEYIERSNYIFDNPETVNEVSQIIKTYGNISGKVDLYRRVSFNELGISEQLFNDDPFSIIDKIITPQGFMSTSKYIDGTSNFDGQLIHFTNVSPSNKGLDISTFSWMYSSFGDEEEVIFNIGTKYKITNIVQYDDNIILEAKIF